MSYHSIKRVLGETNLERKCRFLFGACLLFLITGAFWWVSFVTERLAKETARSTGARAVDFTLLMYHWVEVFEANAERESLVREMTADLPVQDFRYTFLKLDPKDEYGSAMLPGTDPVDDEQQSAEERALIAQLQQKQAAQLSRQTEIRQSEVAGSSDGPPPATPEPTHLDPLAGPELELEGFATAIDEPVYVERWLPERGEYQYYQPVYWKSSCEFCHTGLMADGAFPAADAGALRNDHYPFRAVKVIIPDAKTQNAIEWTRAILIATAIITVFVSMIALYIIVRYVIVKPLTHLRDTSDEVSRGNLGVRAEIQTNDEFEDLAESFNRMLRSLIDTQQELRSVNTDLDAKVDELARVNMRLYEMNRMKSDFLASMSHELRTPLNSIIGFSDVLKEIESLNPKQKRYAQNIQQSGRVLLDMINDILDLAKMESGRMEVRPSEFRLAAVLSAQCDMMRSLAEDKDLQLICAVDEDLPPLCQDQSKVQQIVTNLLSNAIKFTPDGGTVWVRARRQAIEGDPEMVAISVEDTGVGIAEDDREVIFEKFRQSRAVSGKDSLTREYSGTGLGLSIVRELCMLMGGEVRVESVLGKGSTFTVRLPWRVTELPRTHVDSRPDISVNGQPSAPTRLVPTE